MTENSNAQLVVKARFNFQQTNEDELSFSKGDIISVTRTEEGGWWEGSLNGKTGWFPSNYVREVKGSGKCLFAVDHYKYINSLILIHSAPLLEHFMSLQTNKCPLNLELLKALPKVLIPQPSVKPTTTW